MVPCLHQGNIYIKRKLRVWRDQKCIYLVGAESPLIFAGHQTTPSQGSRYRVGNGNLHKLGWIYRHGTVFAPRQYLHQNEATGMERPEMYLPSWCKKPSYRCGPSKYRVSRRQYRVGNRNLRKLGWTYRYGTVFAPRQYLHQKEATGKESPEMYFPCRCKKPSYLRVSSNYRISKETVQGGKRKLE